MARRKVKNGEKTLGTMSYQTSSKLSWSFWLLIGARKLLCFSAQSEGDRRPATVWNWPGKTLGTIHSTKISGNFGPTGKVSKKRVHLLR